MPDLTENSNNFPSTFSRASAKWIPLAGTLTEYAVDVPSFGDSGVVVTTNCTNYCTYSDDLTNAAWTKTNCTAAAGAPTTILGSACTKLTDSGSGGGYAEFSTSYDGNIARGFLCMMAKCATGTVNATLYIEDSAGTPLTFSKAITVTTTEDYFYLYTGNFVDTLPLKSRIVIDDAGGEIFVNLVMVSEDSFNGQLIPTSGSAVTQSADSLVDYSVSGIPTNDYKMTCTMSFPDGASPTAYAAIYTDVDNWLRIGLGAANPYQNFKIGGAFSGGQIIDTFSPDTEYEATLTVSSTTGITVDIGGSTYTDATKTSGIGAPTHVSVGNSFGSPASGSTQVKNLKVEAL